MDFKFSQSDKILMRIEYLLDYKTYLHSMRVGKMCEILVEDEMFSDYSLEERKDIIRGAYIHDLGKCFSVQIQNMPCNLSNDMRQIINIHPIIGGLIIRDDYSKIVTDIVKYHHVTTKTNTVYPDYPYNSILQHIELICMLDKYDAMLNKRSYKSNLSRNDVIKELEDYKYSCLPLLKKYSDEIDFAQTAEYKILIEEEK